MHVIHLYLHIFVHTSLNILKSKKWFNSPTMDTLIKAKHKTQSSYVLQTSKPPLLALPKRTVMLLPSNAS